MASRRKRERYHQIEEDEWTAIIKRGLRDMCCACGLVHKIDTREIDGVLEVRKKIDHRATAAARRVFKYRTKKQ